MAQRDHDPSADELDPDLDAGPENPEENTLDAIVQNEEDLQAERLALLGVPPPIKVQEYFSKDEELKQPVELIFGAFRRIARV